MIRKRKAPRGWHPNPLTIGQVVNSLEAIGCEVMNKDTLPIAPLLALDQRRQGPIERPRPMHYVRRTSLEKIWREQTNRRRLLVEFGRPQPGVHFELYVPLRAPTVS